ncbi:MAG: tRNA (adenosine(37)-N6)-threonylcarbamoyltransferase complex ATPase subunit type 1 TsaE [Clostridiales bacterium GWB2_37_7]|nr:MAG: tRNA (adenosine(37)-N6)-threonylcarbamoyltransferase complex ATPase subunit type 1 TsaE [Clostridiales bacterium GWB2_37_7]
MLRIISKSAEQTYKLGEKLGKNLQQGDIICLTGDLGAGKTAFTKGIGAGLDVKEFITSPTYTIINEYNGSIPLFHFDVYRLEGVEEMYELGYEEYFFGDGAVVIEWADIVKDIIPQERLWVTILRSNEEDSREIIFDASGERYQNIVEELMQYADTSH